MENSSETNLSHKFLNILFLLMRIASGSRNPSRLCVFHCEKKSIGVEQRAESLTNG